MALLTIFDTDPNAKPKPKQAFSDDTVGRFHSGRQVDNLPEALSEWRITTGDPVVAQAVAQLFGGEPIETDSTGENFIDVFTDRETVPIVLDGPKAIYADLKLWNRNKLVHHCDGSAFLSPDEKAGRPCHCPELFAERKQAAKDFLGPSPSITVTFRLADDPELGKFKFQSGSWVMASVLHEYENDLSAIDGPALAELTLELVEYTIKKGKNKGLSVSYYKPVIKVLKSYNDAIADER
ncbi:recombination directionality factor [Streptomyces sp. O3]